MFLITPVKLCLTHTMKTSAKQIQTGMLVNKAYTSIKDKDNSV